MTFTTEDLSVFFADEDFATEAGYLYYGDGSEVVPTLFRVIFDSNFKLVLDGVESSATVAHCKTTDLALYAIKHGDEIFIADIPYLITGVQNHGDGVTSLLLEMVED